jgi:NAD(P)H-dependent FMN reductase
LIVGILGSAAKDSGTRLALETVAERFRSAGRQFDLVDLAVEYRELHDIVSYHDPAPDSQTALLRQRVSMASAAVLATPVYHGTFSALLKNALDHLWGDAFAGKAVGIVAHGSAEKGVTVAADHLRTVIRALGGWSAPTQVAVVRDDFLGTVPTAETAERFDSMVSEILSFGAERAHGRAS